MLAPLLFVWPLSIAFTHYFANNVANYPYDQALREHVSAIARQIKLIDGKPVLSLPASARAAASAEVKFENRKAPVENARILDAFKPLERHVYVIDL